MGKGSKERLCPRRGIDDWIARYLNEARLQLKGKREPEALRSPRVAPDDAAGVWHLIGATARAPYRQEALAARAAPRLRHGISSTRRRPARGAAAAGPRRYLDGRRSILTWARERLKRLHASITPVDKGVRAIFL